ncbi:hypothetical protein VTK56DRAFT_7116 [Thermocarpiscus australiensis]
MHLHGLLPWLLTCTEQASKHVKITPSPAHHCRQPQLRQTERALSLDTATTTAPCLLAGCLSLRLLWHSPLPPHPHTLRPRLGIRIASGHGREECGLGPGALHTIRPLIKAGQWLRRPRERTSNYRHGLSNTVHNHPPIRRFLLDNFPRNRLSRSCPRTVQPGRPTWHTLHQTPHRSRLTSDFMSCPRPISPVFCCFNQWAPLSVVCTNQHQTGLLLHLSLYVRVQSGKTAGST